MDTAYSDTQQMMEKLFKLLCFYMTMQYIIQFYVLEILAHPHQVTMQRCETRPRLLGMLNRKLAVPRCHGTGGHRRRHNGEHGRKRKKLLVHHPSADLHDPGSEEQIGIVHPQREERLNEENDRIIHFDGDILTARRVLIKTDQREVRGPTGQSHTRFSMPISTKRTVPPTTAPLLDTILGSHEARDPIHQTDNATPKPTLDQQHLNPYVNSTADIASKKHSSGLLSWIIEMVNFSKHNTTQQHNGDNKSQFNYTVSLYSLLTRPSNSGDTEHRQVLSSTPYPVNGRENLHSSTMQTYKLAPEHLTYIPQNTDLDHAHVSNPGPHDVSMNSTDPATDEHANTQHSRSRGGARMHRATIRSAPSQSHRPRSPVSIGLDMQHISHTLQQRRQNRNNRKVFKRLEALG